MSDPRRAIPAVEALLEATALAPLVERAGRERVTAVLREIQAELRERLAGRAGGEASPGGRRADARHIADPAWYAEETERRIERADRPSLRRVINATGVVLHTNLGRAPLAEAALQAVAGAAGYASLEYDLEGGSRGSRHGHYAGLLRELTGAGDALVVNNNAAAVVLALNTLAAGRSAVISRGELVEIGGSFRVPEIMARSGVRMHEVGATNRTHLADYRDALGPDVAVILKVHRSNFRVEGFTAEVPARQLAELADEAGIPLLHDLGSGALLDMTELGLPPEPTAASVLEDGAAVATLSGDKLMGGPQAGILLGRPALLRRMRANPLCRALRPDKLTLAALEATLRLYRDPARAVREIPTLRMLAASPDELAGRARALADRLEAAGVTAAAVAADSKVGGGAYPGAVLPSTAVAIDAPRVQDLARRLRLEDPPVIARVREDRLLLDPRTIAPAEEDALVSAVVRLFGEADE